MTLSCRIDSCYSRASWLWLGSILFPGEQPSFVKTELSLDIDKHQHCFTFLTQTMVWFPQYCDIIGNHWASTHDLSFLVLDLACWPEESRYSYQSICGRWNNAPPINAQKTPIPRIHDYVTLHGKGGLCRCWHGEIIEAWPSGTNLITWIFKMNL